MTVKSSPPSKLLPQSCHFARLTPYAPAGRAKSHSSGQELEVYEGHGKTQAMENVQFRLDSLNIIRHRRVIGSSSMLLSKIVNQSFAVLLTPFRGSFQRNSKPNKITNYSADDPLNNGY